MGLPGPLLKSRGVENSLHRVMYVMGRFGVTPRKIENELNKYVDVAKACGCLPTFPITAVVLGRHPQLVRALSRRGVEFAVHGYVHNDYRQMDQREQTKQIEEAVKVFQASNIPFCGFRAPYLRSNAQTLGVLSRLGFLYDSSETVLWDVLEKAQSDEHSWKEYENVLSFYAPVPARNYMALPRSENGVIEIPVSLPDDEALVDRLGITNDIAIARVWYKVGRQVYHRGEAFVLQLHHERLSLARAALASVLSWARRQSPPVWVATLAEIAEWWKERQRFAFEIAPAGSGRYRVSARCSDRATILIQNCRAEEAEPWWSAECPRVNRKVFVVESPRPPIVGVAPGTAEAAVNFLRSEGFAVQTDTSPENVGVYLDNLRDFARRDEKPLSETVDASAAPLVRFWRWPGGARSAMAVTGDIDSITLVDFFRRFVEVGS